ncbi:hypothetical protein ACIHDR_34680 [Nocardia sp. NPDC052278]|uniref:hypothetical protein n=1 Tax=unclassified Nocardia TaxID=2637762 RepID=UPI0036BA87E5
MTGHGSENGWPTSGYVARRAPEARFGRSGFAGLSLIVAIAAAAAIYRWVDEPLMRRFVGRRAVRPPATARDPVDRVTASVGP